MNLYINLGILSSYQMAGTHIIIADRTLLMLLSPAASLPLDRCFLRDMWRKTQTANVKTKNQGSFPLNRVLVGSAYSTRNTI